MTILKIRFFITNESVVVYDAKPGVALYLLKVVKEVTANQRRISERAVWNGL